MQQQSANAAMALGRHGEDLAARFLVEAGYGVLERNWRCELGEIDIVARLGGVLVVCEVKTRRGIGCGTPLDAVTPVKLTRLRRLAGRWMADRLAAGGSGPESVRIDVIGVLRPLTGAAEITHVQGVG